MLPFAFDNAPVTLVDDPSGTIVYHPGAVDPAQADAWFGRLLAIVPWQAERRWMYERQVDVPRLTAHYALADAPAPIGEAAAIAARLAHAAFNAAGLNRYRDGRDSVAPHNDKLHRLIVGAPIALLSLGAARRMAIRAKAKPRRTLQIDLEPGSVLVMSYPTQQQYDHGIAKTRAAVGERISIAFRALRPDALRESARPDTGR